VKVDLHSHTRYSRDSLLKPAELVARARSLGLHRIAVTDHNELDGAREAKAIDPSLVIIGEEIDCEDGTHLIGLFLRERIPPGLSVQDTAARIREQGGVVYAPHPYAYLSVAVSRALRTIAVADVVEVFNARAFLPAWNRRALDAARARGLPLAAGTDSHFAFEIGSAWTELPEFDNADELRRSLAKARPVSRKSQSPLVHCGSFAVEMLKTVGILPGHRSGTSPAPSPSPTNPATSPSD
jgi:predicted metal-dependent phosphoesterase TrpH